jgi:hypothetical protein
MKTCVGPWARWPGAVTALLLAVAAAACSDVGDNTSGGGVGDASESDVVEQDVTMPGSGDDASDAQAIEAGSGASDAPTGDAMTIVEDAGDDADATLGEPDAAPGVDGSSPEAGGADGGAAETGAPEAGVSDAGPDATLTEAGAVPEAGADASASDGGVPDSGGTDAALESGADTGTGSSLPVPCTTAGQTNCVECDQNSDHLCTPSEAILVTRDIEKGLYSGNLPAPAVMNTDGTTGGSCYECMAISDCIDSTLMGFTGLECGDLAAAAVQPCLDTLNCVLGTPQAGTAGATGTPNPAATAASLSADCTNAGDGVFNCFCGSDNATTTLCSASPTVAAAAATSPNGACLPQVFAGTGTTSSTANSTIIADLSNVNLGAGLAFSIPICAGSNQSAGQACPQCYR